MTAIEQWDTNKMTELEFKRDEIEKELTEINKAIKFCESTLEKIKLISKKQKLEKKMSRINSLLS